MSAAGVDGPLQLHWRPFRFALPLPLVTAHGALEQKHGWLLRLEAADGRLGWGEAAALRWQQTHGISPGATAPGAGHQPMTMASAQPSPPTGGSAHSPEAGARQDPRPPERSDADPIAAAIAALGPRRDRDGLEAQLPQLPPPLAFALGLALAELDGLGGPGDGWLAAPVSARLLPAGEAMPAALEAILTAAAHPAGDPLPLTIKWKVAAGDGQRERELLEWLLQRLPLNARLRLDANGGWDRATAGAWAARLADEPRLEWLEQPLAPGDGEGLRQLAHRVPVALDESLQRPDGSRCRSLTDPDGWPPPMADWPGWLVRRPALEGDPRPLLADLLAGRERLMVSTALETGIGMRLLAHLAALQQRGPTPTAPGLAPGWRPAGGLFAADPHAVWRAAAKRP